MSVEIRDVDSCGEERRTLFVDGVQVWVDWTHSPEDVCLSRDLDSFVKALHKLSDERDAEREKVARLERERGDLVAQLAALRAEVRDALAEP